MVNLLISLFFFGLTAMLYKLATHRNCDQLGVIVMERIAVVLCLFFYVSAFDRFQFKASIIGLGLLGGAAIFISRWALLHALRFGKISSSWTITNLSVAIPVIASIFIWKEMPDAKKAFGLLLVPLAIFMLQEKKEGQIWSKLILIALIFCGISDTMFKMIKECGLGESRNTYIFVYNFFALLFALVFLSKNKKKVGFKEMRFGFLIGTAISAGVIFSMNAVMQLPGMVVFPLLSGGGLVSVTVLSVIFWKERLTLHQNLGLVFACIAIVLIALP